MIHQMRRISLIFRTFHPNSEEYTFFSSAHGTFSRIDHILGHKSNLSKFKKIEIVSSIFSNHNALRPDIDYKKKSVRNTIIWRLNNTFLNNQQVTEKNQKGNKKNFQKQMTMKTQQLKTYGRHQKQFQEGSLQQYNPTSRNIKNIEQKT